MPRILFKLFLVCTPLLLVGCDHSDSTQYPEDGREQPNPINNQREGYVTGRALDGYLVGARVWMDLNQNGEWDNGEPETTTGAGGHYELDVRALQQDITVGPDLDPRDYPLMLLAEAGETLEEVGGGNVLPVEKSFLLMAPPGTTTISPFTTLVEFQRRLPGGIRLGQTGGDPVAEASERVRERLGPELNGVNLLLDYLQGNHPTAAIYGRAITAYLAEQVNQAEEQAGTSLSPSQLFGKEGLNVFGGITLGEIRGIVDQTTELMATHGEEALGSRHALAELLDIPVNNLKQKDPWVLHTQQLFMDPAIEKGISAEQLENLEPGNVQHEDEYRSAELRYFYDSTGRLQEIQVDGWTRPNLVQLLAVVEVGGVVDRLRSELQIQQYGPGLLVDYFSDPGRDDWEPQERYEFDWASGEIRWYTNNFHEYPNANAELGQVQGTIQWTGDARTISLGGQSVEQSVSVSGFRGNRIYTFDDATWAFNYSNEPSADDEEEPDYYCETLTITDAQSDEGSETKLYDTYRYEDGEQGRLETAIRLVTFGFPAPVEWDFSYMIPRGEGEDEEGEPEEEGEAQPELISSVALNYILEDDLGRLGCTVSSREGRRLAESVYTHTRLSSNLAERGSKD